MIQSNNLVNETKHWYILDKDGDIAIRVKSELKLGESTDGQLALTDDVKANQWVRLFVNAEGELWLTVVDSGYVLQTHDQAKSEHFQLKAGAQIQLPNNDFTISDHPFLCEPAELVVKVQTQENAINLARGETHCKSQLAKNKLLADVDSIFAHGNADNIRPANDVIQPEPSLAIEPIDRAATQAQASGEVPVENQENQKSQKNKEKRPVFTWRVAGLLMMAAGALWLKWYLEQ